MMKFLRLFEAKIRYQVMQSGDDGEIHAWIGNQHVGVVEYSDYSRVFARGLACALNFIYVHPGFRRQGIAIGLLSKLREITGNVPIEYGDTSPEGRDLIGACPEDWFTRDPMGDNVDHEENPYGNECPWCRRFETFPAQRGSH